MSTYCKPTKLNVNSAIRADSFRPLMDGEPAHLAPCGMLVRRHALRFLESSLYRVFPAPSLSWPVGPESETLRSDCSVQLLSNVN